VTPGERFWQSLLKKLMSFTRDQSGSRKKSLRKGTAAMEERPFRAA
jgi:hypothetical protein